MIKIQILNSELTNRGVRNRNSEVCGYDTGWLLVHSSWFIAEKAGAVNGDPKRHFEPYSAMIYELRTKYCHSPLRSKGLLWRAGGLLAPQTLHRVRQRSFN
jgi:hypothetical protein